VLALAAAKENINRINMYSELDENRDLKMELALLQVPL